MAMYCYLPSVVGYSISKGEGGREGGGGGGGGGVREELILSG